jgi:archaellum component FlaC
VSTLRKTVLLGEIKKISKQIQEAIEKLKKRREYLMGEGEKLTNNGEIVRAGIYFNEAKVVQGYILMFQDLLEKLETLEKNINKKE